MNITITLTGPDDVNLVAETLKSLSDKLTGANVISSSGEIQLSDEAIANLLQKAIASEPHTPPAAANVENVQITPPANTAVISNVGGVGGSGGGDIAHVHEAEVAAAAAAGFGSADPLPQDEPPAPPPPPADSAEAPVNGTIESAAPSVKLDTDGLPWDERIHASSQAFIADGTWRKKRNVDPKLVIQVEDELRARSGQAPAPGIDDAAAPPPPQDDPAPPPPAATGADPAYLELVKMVADAMKAGKISAAQVRQCAMSVGAPDLAALARSPYNKHIDAVRVAVRMIIE